MEARASSSVKCVKVVMSPNSIAGNFPPTRWVRGGMFLPLNYGRADSVLVLTVFVVIVQGKVLAWR